MPLNKETKPNTLTDISAVSLIFIVVHVLLKKIMFFGV